MALDHPYTAHDNTTQTGRQVGQSIGGARRLFKIQLPSRLGYDEGSSLIGEYSNVSDDLTMTAQIAEWP